MTYQTIIILLIILVALVLAIYIRMVVGDIKEEKRQRGQRRRWQDTIEGIEKRNSEKRKDEE